MYIYTYMHIYIYISADTSRGSASEEKCGRMIFNGLEASVLHWQCFRVFFPRSHAPFKHQLGSKCLPAPFFFSFCR